MLVAVAVAVVGFLAVAALTQLQGYRLGGTIVVPVLAVYTLKNLVTLPVFVLSTAVAYLGLAVLKRRTLYYGRTELLATLVVGSVVPLTILLTLGSLAGEGFREVVFVGSILPGLAAYNYHQLRDEYVTQDLTAAVLLYLVLVALGGALVSPRFVSTLGALTPPVLYAETADVAILRGAVVETLPEPPVVGRAVAVGVFGLGMVLAERVRARFGVRVGVIALALLALYALASVWLLALYALTFLLGFAFLELVHRTTLLYGRVLVGLTAAFALLVALPLVTALPILRGLSAFFVAILGGIAAYSLHVTPPAERVASFPLQVAVFVPLVFLARLVAEPYARGVPQELSLPVLVLGAVLTVGSLLLVRAVLVPLPDDESVLRASILSGGGEA